MRLFENDPYTGYERLKRASPDFMDDVLEAQAIWKAQGEEFDEFRRSLVQVVDNILIRHANEQGCKEYEDFFRDTPPEHDMDLAFRQARVAAHFIGHRHIGRPEILAMLSMFTERDASRVSFRFGTIYIDIDGMIFDRDAFLDMLLAKIPTHLGIVARQHYWANFAMRLAAGTFTHHHTTNDNNYTKTHSQRIGLWLGAGTNATHTERNDNSVTARARSGTAYTIIGAGTSTTGGVRTNNNVPPKIRSGTSCTLTGAGTSATDNSIVINTPGPREIWTRGLTYAAACTWAAADIRTEAI